MARPKGFEPYMRIWVVQVSRQTRLNSTKPFNYSPAQLTVAFFTDAVSYGEYKSFLRNQDPAAGPSILLGLRADYGEQKWWNDKVWFQLQMNDLLAGNFQPNIQPNQL